MSSKGKAGKLVKSPSKKQNITSKESSKVKPNRSSSPDNVVNNQRSLRNKCVTKDVADNEVIDNIKLPALKNFKNRKKNCVGVVINDIPESNHNLSPETNCTNDTTSQVFLNETINSDLVTEDNIQQPPLSLPVSLSRHLITCANADGTKLRSERYSTRQQQKLNSFVQNKSPTSDLKLCSDRTSLVQTKVIDDNVRTSESSSSTMHLTSNPSASTLRRGKKTNLRCESLESIESSSIIDSKDGSDIYQSPSFFSESNTELSDLTPCSKSTSSKKRKKLTSNSNSVAVIQGKVSENEEWSYSEDAAVTQNLTSSIPILASKRQKGRRKKPVRNSKSKKLQTAISDVSKMVVGNIPPSLASENSPKTHTLSPSTAKSISKNKSELIVKHRMLNATDNSNITESENSSNDVSALHKNVLNNSPSPSLFTGSESLPCSSSIHSKRKQTSSSKFIRLNTSPDATNNVVSPKSSTKLKNKFSPDKIGIPSPYTADISFPMRSKQIEHSSRRLNREIYDLQGSEMLLSEDDGSFKSLTSGLTDTESESCENATRNNTFNSSNKNDQVGETCAPNQSLRQGRTSDLVPLNDLMLTECLKMSGSLDSFHLSDLEIENMCSTEELPVEHVVDLQQRNECGETSHFTESTLESLVEKPQASVMDIIDKMKKANQDYKYNITSAYQCASTCNDRTSLNTFKAVLEAQIIEIAQLVASMDSTSNPNSLGSPSDSSNVIITVNPPNLISDENIDAVNNNIISPKENLDAPLVPPALVELTCEENDLDATALQTESRTSSPLDLLISDVKGSVDMSNDCDLDKEIIKDQKKGGTKRRVKRCIWASRKRRKRVKRMTSSESSEKESVDTIFTVEEPIENTGTISFEVPINNNDISGTMFDSGKNGVDSHLSDILEDHEIDIHSEVTNKAVSGSFAMNTSGRKVLASPIKSPILNNVAASNFAEEHSNFEYSTAVLPKNGIKMLSIETTQDNALEVIFNEDRGKRQCSKQFESAPHIIENDGNEHQVIKTKNNDAICGNLLPGPDLAHSSEHQAENSFDLVTTNAKFMSPLSTGKCIKGLENLTSLCGSNSYFKPVVVVEKLSESLVKLYLDQLNAKSSSKPSPVNVHNSSGALKLKNSIKLRDSCKNVHNSVNDASLSVTESVVSCEDKVGAKKISEFSPCGKSAVDKTSRLHSAEERVLSKTNVNNTLCNVIEPNPKENSKLSLTDLSVSCVSSDSSITQTTTNKITSRKNKFLRIKLKDKSSSNKTKNKKQQLYESNTVPDAVILNHSCNNEIIKNSIFRTPEHHQSDIYGCDKMDLDCIVSPSVRDERSKDGVKTSVSKSKTIVESRKDNHGTSQECSLFKSSKKESENDITKTLTGESLKVSEELSKQTLPLKNKDKKKNKNISSVNVVNNELRDCPILFENLNNSIVTKMHKSSKESNKVTSNKKKLKSKAESINNDNSKSISSDCIKDSSKSKTKSACIDLASFDKSKLSEHSPACKVTPCESANKNKSESSPKSSQIIATSLQYLGKTKNSGSKSSEVDKTLKGTNSILPQNVAVRDCIVSDKEKRSSKASKNNFKSSKKDLRTCNSLESNEKLISDPIKNTYTTVAIVHTNNAQKRKETVCSNSFNSEVESDSTNEGKAHFKKDDNIVSNKNLYKLNKGIALLENSVAETILGTEETEIISAMHVENTSVAKLKNNVISKDTKTKISELKHDMKIRNLKYECSSKKSAPISKIDAENAIIKTKEMKTISDERKNEAISKINKKVIGEENILNTTCSSKNCTSKGKSGAENDIVGAISNTKENKTVSDKRKNKAILKIDKKVIGEENVSNIECLSNKSEPKTKSCTENSIFGAISIVKGNESISEKGGKKAVVEENHLSDESLLKTSAFITKSSTENPVVGVFSKTKESEAISEKEKETPVIDKKVIGEVNILNKCLSLKSAPKTNDNTEYVIVNTISKTNENDSTSEKNEKESTSKTNKIVEVKISNSEKVINEGKFLKIDKRVNNEGNFSKLKSIANLQSCRNKVNLHPDHFTVDDNTLGNLKHMTGGILKESVDQRSDVNLEKYVTGPAKAQVVSESKNVDSDSEKNDILSVLLGGSSEVLDYDALDDHDDASDDHDDASDDHDDASDDHEDASDDVNSESPQSPSNSTSADEENLVVNNNINSGYWKKISPRRSDTFSSNPLDFESLDSNCVSTFKSSPTHQATEDNNSAQIVSGHKKLNSSRLVDSDSDEDTEHSFKRYVTVHQDAEKNLNKNGSEENQPGESGSQLPYENATVNTEENCLVAHNFQSNNRGLECASDILLAVKTHCNEGILNKAFQIAEDNLTYQSTDSINEIILALTTASVRCINETNQEFLSKILTLITEYHLYNNSTVCSTFITICTSKSKLTLFFVIEMFKLCVSFNTCLSASAIQALFDMFSSEGVDLSLLIELLEYVHERCKQYICFKFLNSVIDSCTFFGETQHIKRVSKLLSTMDLKLVDQGILKTFIKKLNFSNCFSKALNVLRAFKTEFLDSVHVNVVYDVTSEIFSEIQDGVNGDHWDKLIVLFKENEALDNRLVIHSIYNILRIPLEKSAKKYNKFIDAAFGTGTLAVRQRNWIGLIGICLMLEAHYMENIEVAYYILYCLHKNDINYYELLSASTDTEKSVKVFNLDQLVLPNSVAFTAIDICLEVGKFVAAFDIFTDLEWLRPCDSLSNELKIPLFVTRAKYLLKLSLELHNSNSIEKGYKVLQVLLDSVQKDLRLEDAKEFFEDLNHIYNCYIVWFLNEKELTRATELYEWSIVQKFEGFLVVNPYVSRGIVVSHAEAGLLDKAQSFFQQFVLQEVYHIPTPVSSHLQLEINWTKYELHFVVDHYLKMLFEKHHKMSPKEDFSLDILLIESSTDNRSLTCLRESHKSFRLAKKNVIHILTHEMTPPLLVENDIDPLSKIIKIHPKSLYDKFCAWKKEKSTELLLSKDPRQALHKSKTSCYSKLNNSFSLDDQDNLSYQQNIHYKATSRTKSQSSLDSLANNFVCRKLLPENPDYTLPTSPSSKENLTTLSPTSGVSVNKFVAPTSTPNVDYDYELPENNLNEVSTLEDDTVDCDSENISPTLSHYMDLIVKNAWPPRNAQNVRSSPNTVPYNGLPQNVSSSFSNHSSINSDHHSPVMLSSNVLSTFSGQSSDSSHLIKPTSHSPYLPQPYSPSPITNQLPVIVPDTAACSYSHHGSNTPHNNSLGTTLKLSPCPEYSPSAPYNRSPSKICNLSPSNKFSYSASNRCSQSPSNRCSQSPNNSCSLNPSNRCSQSPSNKYSPSPNRVVPRDTASNLSHIITTSGTSHTQFTVPPISVNTSPTMSPNFNPTNIPKVNSKAAAASSDSQLVTATTDSVKRQITFDSSRKYAITICRDAKQSASSLGHVASGETSSNSVIAASPGIRMKLSRRYCKITPPHPSLNQIELKKLVMDSTPNHLTNKKSLLSGISPLNCGEMQRCESAASSSILCQNEDSEPVAKKPRLSAGVFGLSPLTLGEMQKFDAKYNYVEDSHEDEPSLTLSQDAIHPCEETPQNSPQKMEQTSPLQNDSLPNESSCSGKVQFSQNHTKSNLPQKREMANNNKSESNRLGSSVESTDVFRAPNPTSGKIRRLKREVFKPSASATDVPKKMFEITQKVVKVPQVTPKKFQLKNVKETPKKALRFPQRTPVKTAIKVLQKAAIKASKNEIVTAGAVVGSAPDTGSHKCTKDVVDKIQHFLKIKILNKYNNLKSSALEAKAMALANDFLSKNAFTKLDSKTMKTLMIYSNAYV